MSLSKLDVVNNCLGVIGLGLVSSLTTPSRFVSAAINLIDQANASQQARGWWFNSEYNVTLSPNLSGEVLIPASAISCIPASARYAQRGPRVFDTQEQTYTIGKPVECSLIQQLDWDLLPVAFQDYVSAKAMQMFGVRFDAGANKARELAQQEEITRKALMSQHVRASRANILNSGGIGATRHRARCGSPGGING